MSLRNPSSFFRSPAEDEDLEVVNQELWRSLLGHVRTEIRSVEEVRCVLDVGCHRGGLLELLAQQLQPERLFGLEPLAGARTQALFRLKGKAAEVRILDPSRWPDVPTAGVDLATAHEVLSLIPDLEAFMASLARVLRPGGWAFLVLGCHSENPLWPRWKRQLAELGHEVFDHSPLDVLGAASAAGFHTSVRPLRRDGWVIYDPLKADFTYSSAAEMLDHHYRHKLLFRLVRRGTPAR